ESLAALLAKRPPAQWNDEDHARFRLALREAAQAFYKLEPLAYDLAADEKPEAPVPSDDPAAEPASRKVRRVRLFVKTLSESEEDGIIHIHQEDDDLVDDLYEQLAGAVRDAGTNADVKLAALSRLAAELLRERNPHPNPE